MSTFKTTFFPTTQALQERMTVLLQNAFCKETDKDYAVVLSGGNTPLPVYEALSKQTKKASKHLHLCLSDERHVPYDDDQNNAAHILPMLNTFQIPEERFLRVNTNQTLLQSANQFDDELRAWQDRTMHFPLGLLGIGTDGHTASLFSADDVEKGKGHLAIPVTRPTPPDRISTTPEFLRQVEHIIILAAGTQKHEILHILQTAPETIPCGLALKACKNVEIWATKSTA